MKLAWSLVLCLTLPSIACRSTGGDAASAWSGSTDASIEAKLEILDYRTVGVGASRATEFDLRNASSSRLEFLYTVDWFDGLGKPVSFAAKDWIRMALDAGARARVHIEPMPSEARSSRLRFSSTSVEHRK